MKNIRIKYRYQLERGARTMPKILSIGTAIPKYPIYQDTAVEFAKEMFEESFKDINRLLTVFKNGEIEKRHFARNVEWFKEQHTFEEKNNLYIEEAVTYGVEAINACLQHASSMNNTIPMEEVEAIFIFPLPECLLQVLRQEL